MIVLDSSAVITWLLGLPAAPAVEERIGRVGETRHAPELMPIEVAQVESAGLGDAQPRAIQKLEQECIAEAQQLVA